MQTIGMVTLVEYPPEFVAVDRLDNGDLQLTVRAVAGYARLRMTPEQARELVAAVGAGLDEA